MAETAQTLIKSAYRKINAIASGETPTDAEMQDGLEAMKFMLRSWSADDLRLYYTKQESLSMDGSSSYTIGSGGDLDTVRPVSIRGAWTSQRPIKLITEDRYRQVRMTSASGAEIEFLWYSPEFTLGVLYPWPTGGTTLYIDSLKPLTDPTGLTADVSFPPEYDEAIVFNLAVRVAPEFEKDPSQLVLATASSSLRRLKTRNFAHQINEVRPEVLRLAHARYNIDYD